MRYSLRTRFEGALLGAILGDVVGMGLLRRQLLHQTGGQDAALAGERSPEMPLVAYGSAISTQFAILYAQSLIRCGGFDPEDWNHSFSQHPQLASVYPSLSPGATAIAVLPVSLFFHESENQLCLQLQRALSLQQPSTQSASIALALGYAIAQALQEKLNPETLIAQIVRYLQTVEQPKADTTALMAQLSQVQTLLDQGVTLKAAVTQLLEGRSPSALPEAQREQIPFALALYCFLSTPEDFRLALLRALQVGYCSTVVATLTAALSGAYNSALGIPIAWRLQLNSCLASTLAIAQLPNSPTSDRDIAKLAAHLMATWSGTYDTQRHEFAPLPMAVAAPRVIRPR